jgi:hypothetical protein
VLYEPLGVTVLDCRLVGLVLDFSKGRGEFAKDGIDEGTLRFAEGSFAALHGMVYDFRDFFFAGVV